MSVYEGKEVTVTRNGIEYSATVGLETQSGDSRKPVAVIDDRGIYWTSKPVDWSTVSDDEYNEIAAALVEEYRA